MFVSVFVNISHQLHTSTTCGVLITVLLTVKKCDVQSEPLHGTSLTCLHTTISYCTHSLSNVLVQTGNLWHYSFSHPWSFLRSAFISNYCTIWKVIGDWKFLGGFYMQMMTAACTIRHVGDGWWSMKGPAFWNRFTGRKDGNFALFQI